MRSSSPTAAARMAPASWPPRAALESSPPRVGADASSRPGWLRRAATGSSWSTPTPACRPRPFAAAQAAMARPDVPGGRVAPGHRRDRRLAPGGGARRRAPLAAHRTGLRRSGPAGAALAVRRGGRLSGDPHHGGCRADPAHRAARARGAPVPADSRRRPPLAARGQVRGTLRNAALLTLFLAGVSRPTGWPAGIGRSPVPDDAHGRDLPQGAAPGSVKTRLAAAIGERQALRLYRVMASRTLAAVREAGFTPRSGSRRPTPAPRCGAGWARTGTFVLRPRAISARGWRPRSRRCRAGAAGSRSAATARGSTPSCSASRPRRVAGRDRGGPERGWRILPDRRPDAAAGGAVRGIAWSTGVLAETRARLTSAG